MNELIVAPVSFRLEDDQVVVQRRLVSNLWEVIAVVRHSGQLESALREASRVTYLYDGSQEVEVVLALHSTRSRWIELNGVLSPDELWAYAADVFAIDREDAQIDIVATRADAMLLSIASIAQLKAIHAVLSTVGLRVTRFLGLLDRDYAPRDAVFYATVAGCLPRLAASSWPALRTIDAHTVDYIDICSRNDALVESLGEVPLGLSGSTGHCSLPPVVAAEIRDWPTSDETSRPFRSLQGGGDPTLPHLMPSPSEARAVNDSLVDEIEQGSEDHRRPLLGRSIVICSPFGGSGKSLVGQLLRIALTRRHLAFYHVVADKLGPSGRSATGSLFSDVLDLGVGARPSILTGSSDENAPLRFWDRLGETFRKGDAIVEIGTNVMPGVLAWASKRQAGKILEKLSAQRQTLVVTFPASIPSSVEIEGFLLPFLESTAWRVNKIVLCANEHMCLRDSVVIDSLAGLKFGDVEVVGLRVPHCSSPLLHKLHSLGLPLPHTSRMDFSESAVFSDMGVWETIGSLHDLYDWMDIAVEELERSILSS